MMTSISDLTALTPSESALLKKHCELSGNIRRLVTLRTFLVNEIHEKRGVMKRKKYKIFPELERPYGQILFGGRKRTSFFDVFPCSYRGILDSLMFREFKHTNIEKVLLKASTDHFNLMELYYNQKNVHIKELHDAFKFDEEEWSLNDTTNDIVTLHRFRDEFLAYMRRVEEVLKETSAAFRKDNGTKRLTSERKRYAKVCGVPPSM
jgi:hypothetical protein